MKRDEPGYDFPIDVLNEPFPEDVVEEKRQGGTNIDFVPWHYYAAYLNWKLPGRWDKKIITVKEVGGQLIVGVRLTIDGVTREALGAAEADKDSWGGAMAEAESQAFRRACAAHGLGLYMYRDGEHAPAGSWVVSPEDPEQEEETEDEGQDPNAPTEKQERRLAQLMRSGYLPEKWVNEQREALEQSYTKATAGATIRRAKEMLTNMGYDPEEVIAEASQDPTGDSS